MKFLTVLIDIFILDVANYIINMRPTSITIKQEHFEWIEENGVNLSKMVRNFLEFIIENQTDFKHYLNKFKEENGD